MQTKKKGSSSFLMMTGEQRYRFFLTEVTGKDSLWILKNSDGWLLLGNDIDSLFFPIWPDRDSAKEYAAAIFETCSAVKVGIRAFFDGVENICGERNCSCLVFPTPKTKGITVSGEKLKNDIEHIRGGKSA
jgi:hypothetical protein